MPFYRRFLNLFVLICVTIQITGCFPARVKKDNNPVLSELDAVETKSSLKGQVLKIIQDIELLKNSTEEGGYEKHFAIFQSDMTFLESLFIQWQKANEVYKLKQPARQDNYRPAVQENELKSFLQELKVVSSFLDVNLSKRSLRQSADMLESTIQSARKILNRL